MKIKQVLLPILVVGATLLWAFKPYHASDKVIRTKEGAFIIPSGVKMSQEDKRTVVQTLRNSKQVLGTLVWYQNGQQRTYGNYDLKALRQVGKELGVNMEPNSNAMLGVVLFKRKIARSKTRDENKFSEDTFIVEKAYITIGGVEAEGSRLDKVLGNYMD